MIEDSGETTLRDDRHLMPWFIPAVPHGPVKDSLLVATMDGNEMRSISLHTVRLSTE